MGSSLTSGGTVGVVFAVVIMSLAAVLVLLVVLKRRGALPSLDSPGGINNPVFGSASVDNRQGVVRFSGGETNA